jgi:Xaa-Pro aminopeptidase
VTGLPAMDVADRVDRLRGSLDEAGCAALLVTHLTNIRYLTGFTGSAAMLLVRADALTFVTDGRYEEQAAGQLAAAGVDAEVVIGRSAELRYADDWFPGATLVPSTGLVEGLRLVKDAGEVARIEAACAIADGALATVAPMLDDGLTEAAFALELDTEMRRQGADDLSFETIVAAGPNGSRPHHSPSDRRIGRGDLVVIDFGALVDGYHSDMTRTLAVGGPGALDETQTRMVAVVRASQAAGVAAVRAGASTRDVDAACREVITEAGWGEAFVHGTGHGVGLDIHEEPRVSWAADATLEAGHVVTVEPGVYLPGHGGVRIEDTVVVTESGCRTLTRAPKS